MTDRDKFEAWYASSTSGDIPAWVRQGLWQAWQAALASQQPVEGGWIDWFGGECPVDDFTEVEYRTSQGSEEIQPAYNLRWTWNGGNTPRGGDIIAYRVVEDEECPECREIEQRRERLIKEVEKSIAELLLPSKNRLGVELPELSEEDKENRILRVNFVVNPEK